MTTAIFVSQGKKRYVGGILTETTGKDISGAAFTIALGLSNSVPPITGWVAPDVSVSGVTSASRVLKLLVSNANTTPLGTYWCWGNIDDNPEVEPFLLQGPIRTL